MFARARSKARAVYEQMVERPMPIEWRESFKLDHIQLPDPEEATPEWQLQYWCEAALHWLVVDFHGDAVAYVEFEG